MAAPILSLRGLCTSFGGLKAVDDLAMDVEPGSIHSVIGPNGAGKTTVFNTVSGFVSNASGRVEFKGRRIDGMKPHRIVALGLARTWQNVRVFPTLTVLENVMAGRILRLRAGFAASALRLGPAAAEERDSERAARGLVEFTGLGGREGKLARNLAYGEQKALEIARAMATEPELILLDEPAAGLNHSETAVLMELVRRIRERGTTVLLIEHDMRMVMGVSDRITVLDHGRKIAEGPPDEVRRDERVIASYLGDDEEVADGAPGG